MFRFQKLTKQQLTQWLSVQASLLPTQEYSLPKCELHINTDLRHESEYLKSKKNYGIDPGVKHSYPLPRFKVVNYQSKCSRISVTSNSLSSHFRRLMRSPNTRLLRTSVNNRYNWVHGTYGLLTRDLPCAHLLRRSLTINYSNSCLSNHNNKHLSPWQPY